MNVLEISMIIFCLMELGNILILYFKPDSKLGNGVAVFDSWFDSKKDENMNLFVHYMAYWVAGVKLIFIFLLMVIVLFGNEMTQICGAVAMILSISTYFWKLHPIIKILDKNGKITPKGYSKTLGYMISAFLIMFSIAVVSYFLL